MDTNKETVKEFVRRVAKARPEKLSMSDIERYEYFYSSNDSDGMEFLTDMPSYSLMVIMEKVHKRHCEIIDFETFFYRK